MISSMKFAAKIATGILALGLAGLIGCSDGGTASPFGTGGTTSTLTPGGATVLYGVNEGTTSIVPQFGLTQSSSNLAPLVTLTPPANTTFNSVATDGSGTLYVGADLSSGSSGSVDTGEVLVYPAGSTGAATPSRIITGGTTSTTTSFGVPQSMHISSTGTLAILSINGIGSSVATMPATSTGTVTPTTLIQGSATQFNTTQCVTIDQTGVVYVSNYTGTSNSILEFAAGSTGNVAPSNTISTGGALPYGLAVDANGNVFTVLDDPAHVNAGEIAVFAPGATGSANPTRVITGNLTQIFYGGGLRLDSVGNLYMINLAETLNGGVFSILAFPNGATGNVAPGLVFQSSALTSPQAEIAVR